MDALEWDEEEIITRHRSWPEGTGLDRIHARPRVWVLGMQESVERHLGDPLPVVLHAVPARPTVEPPTRKMDRARIHEEMAREESAEVEIDFDDLDDDLDDGDIIELGSGEILIEDPLSDVLPVGSSPGQIESSESLPFFCLSELEAGHDATDRHFVYPGEASPADVYPDEAEPVPGREAQPAHFVYPGEASPADVYPDEAEPLPDMPRLVHEAPAQEHWEDEVPFEPVRRQPEGLVDEERVVVDTTAEEARPYADLPATWSSAGLPKVELEPPHVPYDDDWARRSSSLSPVARGRSLPPRRERSGAWPTAIALALTACAGVALVFGVMHLWPQKGALHVDVAGPSALLGGVFVDGRLACPAVPCVVDSLDAGAHIVKVIMPDGQSPLTETHVVRAGTQTIAVMHPTSAPPPAATATPKARVILGSKIQNVKVDVDGVSRGTLPITLADLAPGEHTLRFTAKGRKTHEKQVTLVDHETQRIEDIALELETGTLDIALKTPGARVLLAPRTGYRKNLVGPFPKTFDVAPGSYDVIAMRPGFRPQVVAIEITDAAPRAEVIVELSPRAFVPPRQDIYE